MSKKIIMVGEGGQGVKLLANVLAQILTEMDKFVTLTYSYDAAVRGGNITAYLIFDDEKIDNPLIDTADILLMLSEVPGFSAKKMIVETSIFKRGDEERAEDEVITMPLITIASEEFGSPVFVNMVALGQLLKQLDVDIAGIDFKGVLPAKFIDKNIEAIKHGYSWIA